MASEPGDQRAAENSTNVTGNTVRATPLAQWWEAHLKLGQPTSCPKRCSLGRYVRECRLAGCLSLIYPCRCLSGFGETIGEEIVHHVRIYKINSDSKRRLGAKGCGYDGDQEPPGERAKDEGYKPTPHSAEDSGKHTMDAGSSSGKPRRLS